MLQFETLQAEISRSDLYFDCAALGYGALAQTSNDPVPNLWYNRVRANFSRFANTLSMTSSPSPTDERFKTWGKLLGTVNGGLLGAGLGFALVYALEVALRRTSTHASHPASTPSVPLTDSAMSTATTASSLIVPVCFILGVFVGQYFGQRVDHKKYKLLAGTTGVLMLISVWLLLSLAR